MDAKSIRSQLKNLRSGADSETSVKSFNAVKQCENMEELKLQNVDLLDKIDSLQTKLATLTKKESKLEAEQSKWRETERTLEKKCAEYESHIKTLTARQVQGFSLTEPDAKISTADREMQTDMSMERMEESQQQLEEEIAGLTGRLSDYNKKQVKLETEQGQLRERERVLEKKVIDYEKEIKAFKEQSEKETSSALEVSEDVNKTSSAEKTCQEQGDDAAQLREIIERLSNELQLSKSKEVLFAEERAKWRKEKTELQGTVQFCQIQLKQFKKTVENECAELRKKSATETQARSKPSTRELWVQTDFTMQDLDDIEQELEEVQDEYDNLLHCVQSKELKYFNSAQKRSEEQLKLAQENLDQKENELQEVRAKVKALEKAQGQSLTQQNKTKKQLEDFMKCVATCNALEQEVTELKKERAELKVTVQEERAKHSAAVETLKEQLSQQEKAAPEKQQVSESNAPCSFVSAADVELNSNMLQEMRQQLSSLLKENADIRADYQTLKEQSAQRESAHNVALLSRIESLLKEHREREEMWTNRVDGLTQERDTWMSRLAEEKEKQMDLEKSQAECAERIQEMSQRVADAEKFSENVEKQLEEIRNENAQLTLKVEEKKKKRGCGFARLFRRKKQV